MSTAKWQNIAGSKKFFTFDPKRYTLKPKLAVSSPFAETLTSQSAQRQQKCKIHLSFLYFLVVLGLYNFEFSPKTRARKKKRKERLFFPLI